MHKLARDEDWWTVKRGFGRRAVVLLLVAFVVAVLIVQQRAGAAGLVVSPAVARLDLRNGKARILSVIVENAGRAPCQVVGEVASQELDSDGPTLTLLPSRFTLRPEEAREVLIEVVPARLSGLYRRTVIFALQPKAESSGSQAALVWGAGIVVFIFSGDPGGSGEGGGLSIRGSGGQPRWEEEVWYGCDAADF